MTEEFPIDINRELVRDLTFRLGAQNLIDWIERKAAEIARLGDSGHWIEIHGKVLDAVGVKRVEYSPLTLGAASLKISKSEGPVIEHHRFQGDEHQRFWIAHEVAHLMWRDPSNPCHRLSAIERGLGADPTIEWLCNRFAAALLLPRWLLERSFRDLGFGGPRLTAPKLSAVPGLARLLRVPEQLLARRIWHEVLREEIAIISLFRPKEIKGRTTTWTVQWDAIPRRSTQRQKRLYGRKIPGFMLPGDLPYSGGLDGRWGSLIDEALSGKPSRPIKQIEAPKSSVVGKVERLGLTVEEARILVTVELVDLFSKD